MGTTCCYCAATTPPASSHHCYITPPPPPPRPLPLWPPAPAPPPLPAPPALRRHRRRCRCCCCRRPHLPLPPPLLLLLLLLLPLLLPTTPTAAAATAAAAAACHRHHRSWRRHRPPETQVVLCVDRCFDDPAKLLALSTATALAAPFEALFMDGAPLIRGAVRVTAGHLRAWSGVVGAGHSHWLVLTPGDQRGHTTPSTLGIAVALSPTGADGASIPGAGEVRAWAACDLTTGKVRRPLRPVGRLF
jgi:hypothetical protein